MESISNQTPGTTLFRPTPASTLQNNLAQFYEKTSQFVDEQFRDMSEVPEHPKRSLVQMDVDENSEKPRLNPTGIGAKVDLYA
ncbi:hypothetical protein GF373_10785 [bacterium]|nr:hypothetical protein [bacterium]